MSLKNTLFRCLSLSRLWGNDSSMLYKKKVVRLLSCFREDVPWTVRAGVKTCVFKHLLDKTFPIIETEPVFRLFCTASRYEHGG